MASVKVEDFFKEFRVGDQFYVIWTHAGLRMECVGPITLLGHGEVDPADPGATIIKVRESGITREVKLRFVGVFIYRTPEEVNEAIANSNHLEYDPDLLEQTKGQ